jgi:hypothetical protein
VLEPEGGKLWGAMEWPTLLEGDVYHQHNCFCLTHWPESSTLPEDWMLISLVPFLSITECFLRILLKKKKKKPTATTKKLLFKF